MHLLSGRWAQIHTHGCRLSKSWHQHLSETSNHKTRDWCSFVCCVWDSNESLSPYNNGCSLLRSKMVWYVHHSWVITLDLLKNSRDYLLFRVCHYWIVRRWCPVASREANTKSAIINVDIKRYVCSYGNYPLWSDRYFYKCIFTWAFIQQRWIVHRVWKVSEIRDCLVQRTVGWSGAITIRAHDILTHVIGGFEGQLA